MEVYFAALGTIITILAFMWAMINSFRSEMDNRFDQIDNRFDKLETRVSNLEHDMIEIKTILRMKECCMIKDDRQIRKVE